MWSYAGWFTYVILEEKSDKETRGGGYSPYSENRNDRRIF